jgi:hypothetical protein
MAMREIHAVPGALATEVVLRAERVPPGVAYVRCGACGALVDLADAIGVGDGRFLCAECEQRPEDEPA